MMDGQIARNTVVEIFYHTIDKLSQDSGMMLQFYDNYFPKERRGIFRYLVIGHGGGFTTTSKNNINDCMEILTFQQKTLQLINS